MQPILMVDFDEKLKAEKVQVVLNLMDGLTLTQIEEVFRVVKWEIENYLPVRIKSDS